MTQELNDFSQLRLYITKKGLSFSEVGRKLGVHADTVARFVNHPLQPVSKKTAAALNAWMDELSAPPPATQPQLPQSAVVPEGPFVASTLTSAATQPRRYLELIAWLDQEYLRITGQPRTGEWAARRDLRAYDVYKSFHELSPLKLLRSEDIALLRRELPPPRGRARPALVPRTVEIPFVRKVD